MTDTQWPRYEVFIQTNKNSSHQNVGSVHAPDIELAIQNARDVFVRRPQAHNLWVVPASAILAMTAQEISKDLQGADSESINGHKNETYHVCQQKGQRRSMVFVVHSGEVESDSAKNALRAALRKFPSEDVNVWWVFPTNAVASSSEDEIESMFVPAQHKTYRMPNQYRTITQMMEVRKD